MDQVWKGLSNLDPRDPGGFYKKPPLITIIAKSWRNLHKVSSDDPNFTELGAF